jgi:hypothetical protein
MGIDKSRDHDAARGVNEFSTANLNARPDLYDLVILDNYIAFGNIPALVERNDHRTADEKSTQDKPSLSKAEWAFIPCFFVQVRWPRHPGMTRG